MLASRVQQLGPAKTAGLALPARPRCPTRRVAVKAVALHDAVTVSTQLAGVALAVGAYFWASKEMLLEQDRTKTVNRRECPSCGGTGFEPCMCQRWSDGDVGCKSCSRTGYMRCRSCGGGGTAVPIPITIRRDQ